jgi:Flp pilus assembly pilin Flp
VTRRWRQAGNDRGASAVEYSLLIVFIAAVIFGAVVLLGQHATNAYSTVVGKF